MGNNLADFIERFILKKFFETEKEHVLMCRNDLAIELSCAPSQISYVLSTRFTPEKGFIVESRRGAGGFVRIMRIVPEDKLDEELSFDADEVLINLYKNKAISKREYVILNHLLEFSSSYLDGEKQYALLREVLTKMSDIQK